MSQITPANDKISLWRNRFTHSKQPSTTSRMLTTGMTLSGQTQVNSTPVLNLNYLMNFCPSTEDSDDHYESGSGSGSGIDDEDDDDSGSGETAFDLPFFIKLTLLFCFRSWIVSWWDPTSDYSTAQSSWPKYPPSKHPRCHEEQYRSRAQFTWWPRHRRAQSRDENHFWIFIIEGDVVENETTYAHLFPASCYGVVWRFHRCRCCWFAVIFF